MYNYRDMDKNLAPISQFLFSERKLRTNVLYEMIIYHIFPFVKGKFYIF